MSQYLEDLFPWLTPLRAGLRCRRRLGERGAQGLLGMLQDMWKPWGPELGLTRPRGAKCGHQPRELLSGYREPGGIGTAELGGEVTGHSGETEI